MVGFLFCILTIVNSAGAVPSTLNVLNYWPKSMHTNPKRPNKPALMNPFEGI